jgi:hypothetical protein
MTPDYEHAKNIADNLLDKLKPADDYLMLRALGNGFISFPVTLYWIGYDFMDTEHRSKNFDDKYRFARLIKSTKKLSDSLKFIVEQVMKSFVSKIDMEAVINVSLPLMASFTGKISFTTITQLSLGKLLSDKFWSSLFSGALLGGILSIGGEVSRAIYTARELRERNMSLYYTLKNKGDLDLLYFLVEKKLRPFEDACKLATTNKIQFDLVCRYFLEGINENT